MAEGGASAHFSLNAGVGPAFPSGGARWLLPAASSQLPRGPRLLSAPLVGLTVGRLEREPGDLSSGRASGRRDGQTGAGTAVRARAWGPGRPGSSPSASCQLRRNRGTRGTVTQLPLLPRP